MTPVVIRVPHLFRSVVMQNQARNLTIVALVAALVAVTCWKQSPGQGKADKPAAVEWEYLIDDAAKPTLEKRAESRWEVCGAYSESTLDGKRVKGMIIMKRPKPVKF